MIGESMQKLELTNIGPEDAVSEQALELVWHEQSYTGLRIARKQHPISRADLEQLLKSMYSLVMVACMTAPKSFSKGFLEDGILVAYGLGHALSADAHLFEHVTNRRYAQMRRATGQEYCHTFYAAEIAVHPDWRARGLGKLITQAKIDHAIKTGHSLYLLHTRNPVVKHINTSILGEPIFDEKTPGSNQHCILFRLD